MASELRSSLFVGRVMHHRLSPQRHGFRYRLYMHRLSLDELPELSGRLRLLGINRWRPVVVLRGRSPAWNAGHPACSGWRRGCANTALTARVGAIDLVTHCRVFGYVFNPVSFFFCYDEQQALAAVLVEVNNTFGESHTYVLTRRRQPMAAKKVFHVSPFMTLDGTYRFAFDVSPERLDVRIDLYRRGVPVFASRLVLDRRPLTDRALAAALVRYPLVTLAVIAPHSLAGPPPVVEGRDLLPETALRPRSGPRWEF